MSYEEGRALFTGFLFSFIFMFFAGIIINNTAEQRGKNMIMQEAYERGYAVQCLGKTGYYWECEK